MTEQPAVFKPKARPQTNKLGSWGEAAPIGLDEQSKSSSYSDSCSQRPPWLRSTCGGGTDVRAKQRGRSGSPGPVPDSLAPPPLPWEQADRVARLPPRSPSQSSSSSPRFALHSRRRSPSPSPSEPAGSSRRDQVLLNATLDASPEYPPRVRQVIERILAAAKGVEGVRVHPFGSSVNGFGGPDSDIDLVLQAGPSALQRGLDLPELGRVSDRKRSLVCRTLIHLAKRLQNHGFKVVERVLHAKVPILKLVFGDSQQCDLSVNNLLPVFNTRLFQAYNDLDERAVTITQEFKEWTKKRSCHGAYKGHLSSYSMTLMVIFYMQQRGALPVLQKGVDSQIYKEGDKRFNVAMRLDLTNRMRRVDVSFRDFAAFYTDDFEWGKWVVSVRTGACKPLAEYPELKQKYRGVKPGEIQDMIHIEDPFDLSRNLNCVLHGGSNSKLWWALVHVNAKGQPAAQPKKLSTEEDWPSLGGWKAGDQKAKSTAASEETGAQSTDGRDAWKGWDSSRKYKDGYDDWGWNNWKHKDGNNDEGKSDYDDWAKTAWSKKKPWQ